MSMIKELYENPICEELNLRYDFQLDKEVSRITKKISPDIQEEEIKELLFEASGCGQLYGFITGFKLAVTLMAECFE